MLDLYYSAFNVTSRFPEGKLCPLKPPSEVKTATFAKKNNPVENPKTNILCIPVLTSLHAIRFRVLVS